MASTTKRYSLANPPPTDTPLTGRGSAQEAEVLEVQSLQAEREGRDAQCVQLMERALQIRSRVVGSLGDRLQSLAGTGNAERCYSEYAAASSDLYDCAERLVVKCNSFGVESFKRGDFDTATPLLQYALDLTEEDAYPLREDEGRRRHLRGVTLNNLGCMQRRQGRFREALRSIQESMDTTGVGSPVAYMNMSAILIQLRLGEEAAHMAQRAVDLLADNPEDASLLAVAHHNLAMALEPVDPARCLQEYQTAYRTACATVGADNATTASIQRNWQRYQRSHHQPQPQPRADVSHAFVAQRARGEGNPRRAPPSPRAAQTTHTGGAPLTVEGSVTGSDIFPHPFVSSHQPRRQQHPPAAMANSTPMYKPKAPPRLTATTAVGVSTRRVQPRAAAAVTAAPHGPLPTQATATASGGRSGGNSRLRALGGDEASDLTHDISPPLARPSVAQDRLRRFTAARTSQDDTAPQPQSDITAPSSGRKKRVGDVTSATAVIPSYTAASGRSGPQPEPGRSHFTHTFPGPHGKGKLSPLKVKRDSPMRAKPEVNNFMASAGEPGKKKSFVEGRQTDNKTKGPAPPPRALPPISTKSAVTTATEEEQASARRSTAKANGDDNRKPLTFAVAKDVTQFEKKGGDLHEYMIDRLEMILHDEEELERKYRKATVIQRHYRGHLARRRLGQVRAERRRDERLVAIRRSIAARTIQRGFRNATRGCGSSGAAGAAPQQRVSRLGHGGREHTAATKMQSVARGWLARRDFQRRQQYLLDSRAAAPRIQRWYRCSRARRQLASRRRARDESEAAAREREQRHFAATKVQSAWRGHRDWQRYQDELTTRRQATREAEASRRHAAARAIQCAWRCTLARREYNHRLSVHLAREAQRRAYQQSRTAAITLQAFARGIAARKRTAPDLEKARLRAADMINKGRRTHTAATTIQRAYRGHRAREELAARRAAHGTAMRSARLRVLAGLLQRVGRGYVARRAIGEEVLAMEREAARYHRQLAALLAQDARSAGRGSTAAARMAALDEAEDDLRAELEVQESRERRELAVTLRETRPSRATAPMSHAGKEEGGEREGTGGAAQGVEEAATPHDVFLHASPGHSTDGPAPADSALEALEGFAKIIKAKQQRAERRSVLASRLESNDAKDATARRHDAAAVISRFLRAAVATQRFRAQRECMAQHLAQLEAQEAAGEEMEGSTHRSDEDEPPQPEEGITKPSNAPVPAEAAAPPLAEDEDGEFVSLEAALAAERAKRMAQKAEEERMRKAREELVNARQAHRMKMIGAASTVADLVPYTRKRIDLASFKRTSAARASAQPSGPFTSSASTGGALVSARPSSRESRERAAGATICRVYMGHRARQHARRVRALQDEYLALRVEYERVEGPVLTVERVTQISGSYPPPPYPRASSTADHSGVASSQQVPPQRVTAPASSQAAAGAARHPTVPPMADLERALTPRSSDEVLWGFVRMVEAKRGVAARKEATEAAVRRAEAGAVIARFMRLAAARQARQRKAQSVAEHLDAGDRENKKEVAAHVIRRAMLAAAARRRVAKRAAAVRASLEAASGSEASRTLSLESGAPCAGGVTGSAHVPAAAARPSTAEEIATEDAALAALSAREKEFVTVMEEAEALRVLTRRESNLAEAMAVLEDFVKIIRAKQEAAARRAAIAAHVDQLHAEDARHEASGVITRFVRVAAAKGTRARRAAAVARLLDAAAETDGPAGTSSLSSSPPPSPSSSVEPAPDRQAGRARVPTIELVEQERVALEQLVEEEAALFEAVAPPEVVMERRRLDEIARRLAEDEERCVLDRLTEEEEHLLESQLLDEMSMKETLLAHDFAMETAPSPQRETGDGTTSRKGAADRIAEEEEEAQSESLMSPNTAASVLAGFAKIVKAKKTVAEKKQRVLGQVQRSGGCGGHEGEDADEEESSVADAAIKIQRTYRRLLARRELAALREQQQLRWETELLAEELLNAAATDIQRTFRGYLGRRAVKQRTHARDAFLHTFYTSRGNRSSSSDSSDGGLAPHACDGSTLAPSSLTDRGASQPSGDVPLAHAPVVRQSSGGGGGLSEHAVTSAFPQRASELSGEGHQRGTRPPSGSNSTAIVEEVTSTNAHIDFDSEL